jgi:NADH:ubiquinone oxidoreductase subunit H
MAFALFFLAEYAHIIFMSFLFAILFLGGWSFFINFDLFLFIKGTLIVFTFIWVRNDQLMSLLWKTYLPLSLSFIIVVNSVLWFFNGLPPFLCI